jgi:elongation factor P
VLKATDLRKGKIIKLDGKLVRITDFQHITPGNWRGIVQIKFKDIITGNGSQRRISPEDKFEDVFLDNRKMTYLYKSGDKYVFMDSETFEQPELGEDIVGDSANYLKENDECNIMFYEGEVVSLELPAHVTLKVEYTEPGAKGDTVQNVTKPAKLETGFEIKVPNHIRVGDNVRVDTRTGEFMERVNS